MKITVERCDVFLVGVPQIFDRVKSVAYGSAASQTNDYKIGKNAALRSKNKEWSGQNQNNVSEWNNISTHRLLFQ